MIDYEQKIVDCLEGKTNKLGYSNEEIARHLNYFSGYSEFMRLYNSTGGQARYDIINAIGEIIEKGVHPPQILAQVINFVSIHDLTELEPHVDKLAKKPIANNKHVKTEIQRFKGHRDLATISKRS